MFTVPLLIMLLGLLLWFLVPHSKVAEVGKYMFFCGLLVLTMSFSRQRLF
jgi:hypothetical protein